MTALPAGLPSKIRVGVHDYALKAWTSDYSRDRNRAGECSSTLLEIRVAFDMAGRHPPETLLHEILHAVFNEWHIQPEDNEGRTISALSRGLAAAVRDNPAVFLWIGAALVNEPGPVFVAPAT